MTRYAPSRIYLSAGLVAVGLALFSTWCAARWMPALFPAVGFAASAAVLIFLALRPVITVGEAGLLVGSRAIPWEDIRRVDRTGWLSPLIVQLTLSAGSRRVIVFPGDLDSANSLLRALRRYSREALIDGIPHRQFWGEQPASPRPKQLTPPKFRMLSPEDEADVERLYQRLKSVGRLDKSSDEK